jgi:DNA-binding NarL/FixJ family response regulator
MPFERQKVDPKAYRQLDRIVKETAAMRDHEAGRAEAAHRRAEAIAKARALGLSYEAIAERLGVTKERVRQMATK